MNTIFEAITKDGKHKLVPIAEVRGIVETTCLYSRTERGQFRKLGQMLANMMYCRGYVLLTQIRYAGDGSQTRTVVCAKSI